MKLTDTKIRNAKPQETDYRLPDGHGLNLLVRPNGSKLWQWRYRFQGKEQKMSFGAYPGITISDARKAHEDARKVLANGQNPMLVQKEVEQQEAIKIASATQPFRDLAKDWFAWWKVGKDERYVQNVESRMDADILPALGDRAIDEILPTEVASMCQAIEARGACDIARRAHQTTDQIFRWGISNGRARQNPAGAFKVRDVLKKIERENFPRVELKEFPELLRKINYYDGSPVTKLGLKLMSLTWLRTEELIAGEWNEINWKDHRWDIPKERMKGGKRPHVVPLAKQTIEVLHELQNYKAADGKQMFPGERGNKYISKNTLTHALWNMGYKGEMTGHGFRGVASTWLHENGYDSEHIEIQLAHAPDNDVKAAYNYAKYIPARRKMMQDWADALDKMRAASMKAAKAARA